MDEFYFVKFGTVYFTDDGLVTGAACLVAVEGLSQLLVGYAGNTVKAADNTPYTYAIEHDGKGSELKLRPLVVSAAILASVKSVVDAAIAAQTTINVVITGADGTFDLECVPSFLGGKKPVEYSGKFFNDQIYESAVNIVVSSVN